MILKKQMQLVKHNKARYGLSGWICGSVLFPIVRGGQGDSGFWDLLCRIYFFVTSSCCYFFVQLQQLKKTNSCSSLLLFCETYRKSLPIKRFDFGGGIRRISALIRRHDIMTWSSKVTELGEGGGGGACKQIKIDCGKRIRAAADEASIFLPVVAAEPRLRRSYDTQLSSHGSPSPD